MENLYIVPEPLSNFDIDRTVVTLMLVRHGNLSYTTAVRYVIVGDPASFKSPSGPSQEVVFHPKESSKKLQIVLQANYERNDIGETVNISLAEGWAVGNISVPVRIGQLKSASISIHNRGYRGPFFPDLPVVANVGDSLMHTSLFYDLPLHCITVSDIMSEDNNIIFIDFLYAAMLEPLFGGEGETEHHQAGLYCTEHHSGKCCIFLGGI